MALYQDILLHPSGPSLCGTFSKAARLDLVTGGLYLCGGWNPVLESWLLQRCWATGAGQEPASDVVGCLACVSQVLARWPDLMAPGCH